MKLKPQKIKKEKPVREKGLLKYLLKYLLRYKKELVGALIMTVIFAAASLITPILVGSAIDYIVYKNVDFDGVIRQIIFILACVLAGFTFGYLSQLFINRISFSLVRDLRYNAFRKLNSVPLSVIDTKSHGDLMSRIVNDTDAVSDGLIQGFTHIFSGVVTIAGTIGIMFSIYWKIALVVTVLTPLSIFVSYFIAKMAHKSFKEQSFLRGSLSGLSEELMTNQLLVKSFGYEERAEQRFDAINDRLRTAGEKAMFHSSISNPVTRFINGIVYAAVTVIGAITVMTNPAALTVGVLSMFLSYANQYSKPFNEITGVIAELQSSMASLQRLKNHIEERDEPSDAHLKDLAKSDGNIDIENVEFYYTESRPLIRNFYLKVRPGQRIAIVGPTGCGKTTLINLLMRFYDVRSGTVSVSGVDTQTVTRKSLRSQFGMVLQDTWLFKGTIAENIAYGKEDAEPDEIMEAAKKAHIHNFIMRQEKGYDTVISGSTSQLSEGQKQLLCISRIMLTNPPMLILDEATSNIDTRTEKRIQRSFKEMMKGKTSFIIAHRLSTIEDADLILVMNNGNVIESGSHTELLEKGGFYSYLYNSQFAGNAE